MPSLAVRHEVFLHSNDPKNMQIYANAFNRMEKGRGGLLYMYVARDTDTPILLGSTRAWKMRE